MGINENLWDFPCDHALKIMGEASEPLTQIVDDIISRHVSSFDASSISIRKSRTGKYHSLTAHVRFERKDQVENIFAEFHAHSAIKMVI